MPPRRRWTPEHDEQLRTMHAAEMSVRDIARKLGFGHGTIGRHLTALGLAGGNRTRTAAATQTNRADAAARRAALAVNLLSDAERLRAQLWQPHTYFDWGGKDHDFAEHTVPEPTPADKLKLVQAASALVATIERLTKLDADAGVHEAVGMLDQIAAAIKAAADRMPDPDKP